MYEKCLDCGTVDNDLILHDYNEQPYYLCHDCLDKRYDQYADCDFEKIGDSCGSCGGNMSKVLKNGIDQGYLICEYCDLV